MIDTQSSREARKQFPLALAGGLGIVLIVAAIFVYISKSTHVSAVTVQTKPLAFGAAEQAYAPHIRYSNIQFAQSSNLLNQQFLYITGVVSNDGDRAIKGLAMSADFYDDLANKELTLHDTETVIGPTDQPLPPHQQRNFGVTIDGFPKNWNQQMPAFHTSGLALQ